MIWKLSLVATVLLPCVCVFGESADLVTNGNFAQKTADGKLAGWKVYGDQVAIESADPPTGVAQSMKVTIETVAAGYGQILQRRPIQPNRIYTLTGQIKSSKPGQAFYQIKLYGGKRELCRITSAKSGVAWKPVSVRFRTDDADKVEILCRYTRQKGDKGHSVSFADVRLVETPPEPMKLGKVSAVATFESVGLTVAYTGDAEPGAKCQVRYRRKGASDWKPATDLAACPDDHEFRGSVVGLTSNGEYEFECVLWDGQAERPVGAAQASARTWSDDVPIAKTIRLPIGVSRQPLVITEQGAPDGWIRYAPAAAGSTLDAGTAGTFAVHVKDAAYVLIDNLTIRGGANDAIHLTKSHHIRIRRCDIAGWGTPGRADPSAKNGLYVDQAGKVINDHAGVQVSVGCSQIVVEDNFIHSPRGTANSWKHGHPAGPQGVILDNTAGNHVVRNNDIIGGEHHWWNDAIEGRFNKYVTGGPHRDTDICGNVFAFSNDDSVELDGGQINVRFFNNWSQWTYCGVSCAPNREGPSYVYRNLFVLTGDERGLTNFVFKMGGNQFRDPGVTYLWHNTAVSTSAAISTGHFGKGGTPIVARNNVYAASSSRLGGNAAKLYDVDYDLFPTGMFTGLPKSIEPNGVTGAASFVNALGGDYRLADGSPGVDKGQMLPNVNDGFAGAGPDLGAFEQGTGPEFPVRRGGMSALPMMTSLACPAGQAETMREIRLTIPASLGKRWTAHSNAAWLACTPGAGGVVGSTRTVRLRLDSRRLDVGRYRGAVTFRTNAGYCRTVLVEMYVLPSTPFQFQAEAESGTIAGTFRKVADKTASGGAFVVCPDKEATRQTGASRAKVTLPFEVPADGTYYLSGRCMAPSPNNMEKDSFFVAIDDKEPVRWDLLHSGSHQWHWMMANSAGKSLVSFELKKGSHTLTVLSREPQARLDAVRITNWAFLVPAGLTP